MQAHIRAIEYYLPEKILTNEQLALEYPEWSVKKIQDKTGIANRHIAGDEECSSDLAVAAANKLFAQGACKPSDIDLILLCTQSPDFVLPTTACMLQERLGIPTTAGALDFNLGCSGFIYGLGMAKGMIETGQARNVLLITAETYSKFIYPKDKSVRTIFGDAAAATWVTMREDAPEGGGPEIGPFVYGTDGKGAPHLIVPAGGMRKPRNAETAKPTEDAHGNWRTQEHLYMHGHEIVSFALKVVPKNVEALLAKSNKSVADIDLFVFHQANRYMLDQLRKRLEIPEEKFYVAMQNCGNTVSSTIPIALKDAVADGKLKPGHRVVLAGFGVGYSWGAAFIRW